MATTTATITLTSTDLLSDSLSVTSTQPLYKAGTTTGIEQYESGRVEVPGDNNIYILVDSTAAGNDKAGKVYITNKNTDVTHYVIISINEQILGRLYAGDWMFVPYNASDGDAEIEVKALNGINKIEYAMFKTAWTLPAAES